MCLPRVRSVFRHELLLSDGTTSSKQSRSRTELRSLTPTSGRNPVGVRPRPHYDSGSGLFSGNGVGFPLPIGDWTREIGLRTDRDLRSETTGEGREEGDETERRVYL